MTEEENVPTAETKPDFMVKKWLMKINKAEKTLKEKHRRDAEQAEDVYYNDETRKQELTIYRSSINSTLPNLYAKSPNPEIRGRNGNKTDPLAKTISKVLEDAITYEIDQSDFDSDVRRSIQDFLITDLGQARIRLDIDSTDIPNELIDGGFETVITSQHVFLDHWPWKRFIWDIGKDWAECDWICYVHYMKGSEIKKQYDKTPNDLHINVAKGADKDGKYTVYEIWDKVTKTVVEIMHGLDEPLRLREDYLEIKGFFDCPKPLIINMRSDKFVPQSEYVHIKSRLAAVNVLQGRIDALIKSIKDAGFFDSTVKQLAGLQTSPDGTLMPVDGLRQLLDGAPNMDNVIAKLPIVNQAQVVQILEQQKKEAIQQLYELTGSSDIQRGSTKASETATAQEIKSQYGQMRLMRQITAVTSWLRSIMRIYAEIIAEKYTPEQLQAMTGEPMNEQMIEVMRSDVLRCYAIDVETDSTIQADESQDKQDRMEMVNTLLPLLQNILPAVQQNMMPMDMGKAILLTAVRGFKYTRNLEDMFEGMGDNMQQLQQLQQQLQQGQQQSQQTEQQYQQQLQQAGQQIQQLQQQLGQINQQEEQRKNADIQAEVAKDYADVEKKKAETAKIWSEVQINQPAPMGVMNAPIQAGF